MGGFSSLPENAGRKAKLNINVIALFTQTPFVCLALSRLTDLAEHTFCCCWFMTSLSLFILSVFYFLNILKFFLFLIFSVTAERDFYRRSTIFYTTRPVPSKEP